MVRGEMKRRKDDERKIKLEPKLLHVSLDVNCLVNTLDILVIDRD